MSNKIFLYVRGNVVGLRGLLFHHDELRNAYTNLETLITLLGIRLTLTAWHLQSIVEIWTIVSIEDNFCRTVGMIDKNYSPTKLAIYINELLRSSPSSHTLRWWIAISNCMFLFSFRYLCDTEHNDNTDLYIDNIICNYLRN